MRELFYDRNPGDARVKVGSDRKVASRQRGPNYGVGEIGRLMIWIMRGGPLQNWPCYRGIYSHKIPYTTVGFCAQIIGAVIGEFTPCLPSDAQLFIKNAHRSNVFYILFFRPWPPKPSRNHPETARVQNRYFSKGF